MRGRGVRELAGGAQRLPLLLPLLFEYRKPIDQKVGEGSPLAQHCSPLGRGVGEESETFSGQLRLFLVLGEVESQSHGVTTCRCTPDPFVRPPPGTAG